MTAAAQQRWLRASVYWHDAQGQGSLREVRLPAPASVGDAVHASGLQLPDSSWQHPGGALRLAVAGRACAACDPLCDGDRVDITRPLRLEPNEARRLRAAAARRRRAGA